MWWPIFTAVNIIIFSAYVLITLAILIPLIRSGQLRDNRLGAATAAIFFSCGVGHGFHVFHMIAPAFGLEQHVALAARQTADWHLTLWDGLTAGIAIYYVTLRKTYGSLMKGAALFEDMKEKQRRAIEINDDILQGLVVAETALALDQRERSQEALEATLVSVREIISDLLGEVGTETRLGPGDLRRREAASVSTSG